MRRYGIWKYTLIIFVLLMGLIYALPNLYAPDPSVQVSYNNSSQETDSSLLRRIEVLFNDSKEKLPTYQIEQNQDFVLVRLSSNEEQLNIKRLLSSELGNDVVVALNLAQTTPRWLADIGASPMKLGLDLRGGVHFLMEVDTNAAVNNRQNGVIQDLKRQLREENIRYNSIYVENDQSISLKLANTKDLTSSIDFLEDSYPQFLISENSEDSLLSLKLLDEEIKKIESDAIDQNLTTLRNRVNELGVSEPIVQ